MGSEAYMVKSSKRCSRADFMSYDYLSCLKEILKTRQNKHKAKYAYVKHIHVGWPTLEP